MKPRISQLAQSGATAGQVATWNGTEWVPADAAAAAVADPLMNDDGSGTQLSTEDGFDLLYAG